MALASKTLGGLGRTRNCPHCRAQILESASICPGCKGHLRFDSSQLRAVEKPVRIAWQVEGTIASDSLGAGTEYSVVISVRNEKNVELSALPVTPQRFGKLLDRIVDGTVSAKAAKQVLFAIAQDGGEPDDLIERLGLRQISDSGALEAAVEKVIAANAKLVDDYRAGKEKAFNALVGQVMKATQGKANPAQVNEILRRRLAAAAG